MFGRPSDGALCLEWSCCPTYEEAVGTRGPGGEKVEGTLGGLVSAMISDAVAGVHGLGICPLAPLWIVEALLSAIVIILYQLPITNWPRQSGAPVGAAPPTRHMVHHAVGASCFQFRLCSVLISVILHSG